MQTAFWNSLSLLHSIVVDWALIGLTQQCQISTTTKRTLERRLKAWGCNRNTKVPASAIPVSRVRDLFHVNLLSDGEIAAKLAEEDGLECTSNQIQEIRLAERLLRRNRSETDQVTSRVTTQHLIKEYVLTGSGRSYGCIWASTFLKEKLGYRARRRDVAAALRTLDPEGTAARTPGLRRARIENYITDGPNHHMPGHLDLVSPR